MECRKPPIKLMLLVLIVMSALTLAAANNLLSSSDEAQYINYLQSQLDQRPFFKRHWSKGKAEPYLNDAEKFEAAGKTEEAIKVLQRYLQKDPSHYLTLWKLLKLQTKNATPLQAVKASDYFLKQLPKFGPALLIRARAYEQIQDNHRAENDFKQALKDPILSDEDRFSAQSSIYYITQQKGESEKAFTLLEHLLRTNPKSLALTKEYAKQLEQKAKLEDAIKTWEKVPRLTRDKTEIAKSLQAKAALLQKQGKSDEALLTLNQVKTSALDESVDKDQQLRLARLYIKKAKHAQALKYLTDRDAMLFSREDIQQQSKVMNYPQYLRTVADLALKLNRHTLAIEAITELNTNATSPQEKFRWLAMLGTIQQNDKRYQEALNYYQRALNLKEDLSLRIQAAEVAWHLQRYDDVARLLQPANQHIKTSNRPDRLKVQQRLCEALEKERKYKEALQCTDKLLKQNPKDKALLLSAAGLAAKSGAENEQLNYLVTAKNLSRPTSSGLQKSYQRESKMRQKKNLEWFRSAYKQERSFPAGYAYASALLMTGQRDGAIIILSRIVNLKGISDKEKYKAHHALGYAMAANGDFVGAYQSWKKANQLFPSPVLTLRLTWALYSARKVEEASATLAQVSVEALPRKEQLSWYELRGMIRHQQKQYKDAISARRYVVKHSPTAKHWSQLAESYAAVNQVHDADNAYEQAIAKSHGDKSRYVLQRAYLKISEKKYSAAQILLDQALQSDPENPVIEEELGYAYARLNMNKQAAEHFKLAVNHYQSEARSGRLGAHKAMAKRNKISENIAKLEQGLRLTVYHSGNLASVNAANNNAALIAPFRMANTGVELSYLPKSIGYRNGKQLQLFARGTWSGEAHSFAPNQESSAVGVGVRYKPSAKQNAWISAEHISGTGDAVEDNVLARATYQKTKGYDWPYDDDYKGDKSRRVYSDVYLDIGKLLENDAPALVMGEARLGRSWIVDDDWMTSAHGYVRGYGEYGDEDQQRVDAGVGLSAKFRGAYDFYEGYKSNGEIYLRLGQDVENTFDSEEKETRATVGVTLSY